MGFENFEVVPIFQNRAYVVGFDEALYLVLDCGEQMYLSLGSGKRVDRYFIYVPRLGKVCRVRKDSAKRVASIVSSSMVFVS